VPLLSST